MWINVQKLFHNLMQKIQLHYNVKINIYVKEAGHEAFTYFWLNGDTSNSENRLNS